MEVNNINVNKGIIIKCLECGFEDKTPFHFMKSEESIPLCPKCLSMQLEPQSHNNQIEPHYNSTKNGMNL